MIAELAHAAHPAAEVAQPMNIQAMASYIVGLGAVFVFATGGVVAYVKLRFSKVESKASGIGKALDDYKHAEAQSLKDLKRDIDDWRNRFLERYARDREAMIERYATQASVEKVEERMEAIRTELLEGMRGITDSINKLRESFKKSGG